ncbi:pentapeptide repeat-containing protein [Nostoc sp. C117]|uniref:pentapeptide repeat-containing protein n=1 Tax=Nostoc sp. C117 TaxID=3349875 RepID=UPI00370D453A
MPQDFSGQNLRGRSFRGQNLEGANFSGADIRSADFTGANLRGANFSCADIRGTKFIKANLRGANFTEAKAGVKKSWLIVVLAVSLLLFGLSGFSYSLAGHLVTLLTDFNYLESPTLVWKILIIIPFFFITSRHLIISVLAITLAICGLFYLYESVISPAVVKIFSNTTTLFNLFSVVGMGLFLFLIIVEIIIIVTIVLLSAYIGWLALGRNKKNDLGHNWTGLFRSFATTFAIIGGTSFHSADLTNTNFTGATLKCTDFRNANLVQTIFYNAKMLDYILPGRTYLQNTELYQVLVTGFGQNKNFDHQNLRGINFQGANLVDASFIGADLSQANLQDADLSRAKLVQTQLNGTDLTAATLTGAYIQDWGITTNTKLDRVRCEYIYMRLPTTEKPDPLRKPDYHNKVFADGEFGDFIQPIFDTLDLYHNQGVDPRAIAISFKQLAENNPEADLRIVGMEVRGEDKFLLHAKTAPEADKSQLSAEYFETYNEIKALPEREIKLLLAEKDSRIRSLENFVNQALQRPSFYSNVEQVGTMTNTPGGFSVGGSVGGNVNNVQGDGNRVVQGDTTMTGDRNINMGSGNYNERIEGDYIQGNKYTAGNKQSLAEAAAEIQKLLKQLEQTNPTATEAQKEAFISAGIAPTKKERLINAFIEGGKGAIEEFLDNPYVNVAMKIIEGWKNA